MTKDSLSSDLDLVKEVEQLRIKQKLLLHALKEKDSREDQEKLLTSISSQLNFLVEIFKEVNAHDEKKEESNDLTLKDLHLSITSLSTTLVDRITALETQVSSLSLQSNNSEQESGSIEEGIMNEGEKISEDEVKEVLIDEKQEKVPKQEELDAPPEPDFSVEVRKEKKGSWFKSNNN